MTTVTLSFPIGLSSEINEAIKPICIRKVSQNGSIITKEFIGVEDNFNELLLNVRSFSLIKISEIIIN